MHACVLTGNDELIGQVDRDALIIHDLRAELQAYQSKAIPTVCTHVVLIRLVSTYKYVDITI